MSQERYLTVNGDHLKKPHIIKTFSFTSDDDETTITTNQSTPTNHVKTVPLYNPSIDTNNNEDYSSENNSKIRKRRSRRQTEIETNLKRKPIIIEMPPWYTKWNFFPLLSIIFLLIFIYFLWIKQDIWLERFLTSNIRGRRSIVNKNENILEQSFDTLVEKSISKEDFIENIKEKNDLNDFIRSNQTNSSNEKHSKNSHLFNNNEKQILFPKYNSTIHYSTYNGILEQLRIKLKSRRNQRKFFSKLSKITGLTKVQLNDFIYKKDFHLITFERFLMLLDLFDLMILIIPKKDF